MKCNLCGNERFDKIYDHARFQKRDILQCQSCGLVCLDSNHSQQSIESYYQTSQYRNSSDIKHQTPDEHYNDFVTIADAIQRTGYLIKHNIDIAGKKVLEVGCATGRQLEYLASAGAICTGIEIDREYTRYAQDNGFIVRTQPIERLKIDNYYDTVLMFHTLEHVYNPTSTLWNIYNGLKPGGYFIGEVPNQDDWRVSIFNDSVIKRLHYDPNHLYYFTTTTLNRYLCEAGFSNIFIETVERYNSWKQLQGILSNWDNLSTEYVLCKHIWPSKNKDDMRCMSGNNRASLFNSQFAIVVNSVKKGNCIRWIAVK